MSKADQNDVQARTRQQQSLTQGKGDAAGEQLNSAVGTSQGRASSIFPGVSAGYSDISSSGGFDPAVLGRLQGGFQGLAENGGIPPETEGAMRRRSAQGVSGIYSILGDQARRTQSATGGFGGNVGSTIDKLARNSSAAQATAITGTDASIAGLRQQGEIAGLTGGANLQDSVARNRLAALGGESALYGTESATSSHGLDQVLQNLYQTGSLSNQDLAILQQISNRPGVFDNIMKTISTAGGAAAGVLTGINIGRK